jgi:hypothetical protein
MKDQQLRTRIFSNLGVSLCANAIEIAGMKLLPDASKAYAEFSIAHTWPVVTAWGTSMHPGTVANSWPSMRHQVFNLAHLMKSYDSSPEKNEIPRDHILGSIVAVEFPPTPAGGWRLSNDAAAPGIRAAAVIHKYAERVPKILGEHLGGRHKWTVSMEVDYSLLDSGFVIGNRAEAKKPQESLMAETTPQEFAALGLGYVPITDAADALLEVYDFDQHRVRPSASWDGLPVTLLKGGVNGQVHFRGVGLVRYGAEREAQIAQILATDPDRLTEDDEMEAGLAVLKEYFAGIANSSGLLPG